MKVFIVCGYVDYEGFEILAVVDSKRKANNLVKKYQDSRYFSFDDVRIQEWEVGEITQRDWEN